MTRDATRPKPVLTGAIQSINPCSQRRWQFVGLGTPTACQRKPKLSEIRIKLVILRFILFFPFSAGTSFELLWCCFPEGGCLRVLNSRIYDDSVSLIFAQHWIGLT